MTEIQFNNTRDITNKWSAMIVHGDPVSLTQAAEIIFKTDSHFPNFRYASNDKDYCDMLNALLGVDIESGNPVNYTKMDQFIRKCGVLTGLDYFTNSQITSAYVGGPHGWCHWDGTIFSNSYNIGKWPDVEQVAYEWRYILETFPYLNLTCQLFDGETCEGNIKPIVTFYVGADVVRVEDADEPIIDVDSDLPELLDLWNPGRERGLPFNAIKEKLHMVYGTIPRMDDRS